MRVLLINPFYPISETPSPPLGLAYLAAALEEVGHTVDIWDFVVFPYSRETLARKLTSFRPEIAGITAVTMTIDHAMEIIGDVKSAGPDILTIAGGPHVTFCADQTLRDHPSLDIIALGEGETTLIDLVDAVASNRPWESVAGIVFRRGKDLHHTDNRPFITDIDTLPPPARHLLPLGRYRALRMPVSMITSRGCPFKCIFCVGRKMVGAKVRYRSATAVVDEMAELNGLGFHQINIADDLFTAKPAHCLAVCDEILHRGLSVRWTSFARVDTVTPEVLKRMKAAGCTGVSFGVETADPDILKTVEKGITVDQVVAAVDMCNDAGLTPYASFILGLPGETPQTLDATQAFARRLEEMGVASGYHLLAPFPGTKIRDRADQYNIRILTDDWTQYHANRAIVDTPSVTAKMLDDIVSQWRNAYDAYLGDIADRMAEGTISDVEAAPLVGLERTVIIYDIMMDGMIESTDRQAFGGKLLSDVEALAHLIKTVCQSRKEPVEKIRDGLNWAFEQGHLLCYRDDGQVRWQWADRLG